MKTYNCSILDLLNKDNNILVFGSNTQGKHGAGVAKIALLNCKAKYGEPKGLQGTSYAIITKDLTKSNHPSIDKEYIIEQIQNLYNFALDNSQYNFIIPYNTQNKNLNYYTAQDMADMFNRNFIPDNIIFEEEFSKLIKK